MNKKTHEKPNFSITNIYKKTPNWLKSAILYGFSWSLIFGLNLNFLAWFAFVPLFLTLENKNSFRSFYFQGLLFTVFAYIILCHGFTITPKQQILTLLASANELFMASIPFALLYPFKKKFGFEKALFFFPSLIVLWEFVYQWFEHTYGYLLLSHSQSQNLWLIQFIDIFGTFSIGFWVMTFNTALFFVYKKYLVTKNTSKFIQKIAIVSAFMLVPPSVYSVFRFSQLEKEQNNLKKVNLTLINSNFSITKTSYDNIIDNVNRLTYITDSINYEFEKQNFKTDLYIWHEGVVVFGEKKEFIGFLDTAVNDWKTPLLTGMTTFLDEATTQDRRRVNRSALIPVGATPQTKLSHYDKVRLAAGHEYVPYHNFFSKISFFPIDLYDSAFYKNGKEINLVKFKTNDNQNIAIGTPICMEQNYPKIWSEMSVKGADFFVQLSVESWWSVPYFVEQMSFITRLRAIETRKFVARCSNGGKTQFYDFYGRIFAAAKNKQGITNANVMVSKKISFYSKNPNLFLLLNLLSLSLLVFWFRRH